LALEKASFDASLDAAPNPLGVALPKPPASIWVLHLHGGATRRCGVGYSKDGFTTRLSTPAMLILRSSSPEITKIEDWLVLSTVLVFLRKLPNKLRGMVIAVIDLTIAKNKT